MALRRMAFVVLFGLFLSRAAGAQRVSVIGRVADPQGGVVVNASVTLAGAAGVRPVTVRTNAQGTFTFDAVTPGRYVVQIDSPGFTPWMQDVVVDAGTATLTATLQIAGIIEDVQVSGAAPFTLSKPVPTASRLGLTPLETPASVAVLSGNVIRDLGTPTLIVAKSMAPGITSQAPMGSGGNVLNARGFTGVNSVKQLFNGMEIYNAGGVVSFPFDPWNVDHIEIGRAHV